MRGRTRNSFEPDCSLVMSNRDLRGVNLIMARSLLDVGERNGLDTEIVPWEDWKARSSWGLEGVAWPLDADEAYDELGVVLLLIREMRRVGP